MAIEDAQLDPAFQNNALVAGPPRLRLYAGAPLVGAGGQRYGTLFIWDAQPRSFPQQQLTVLANFAELCVGKLEQQPQPQEQRQPELQQGRGPAAAAAAAAGAAGGSSGTGM